MPWGWLKRGTRPRLMSMVPEARMGTSTMRHRDVPRFGALRRDNTPSPAELAICNNSGYNECSLSCLRGRRRGPLVTTLSLLSLRWVKCNNYGGVRRTGGVPGALIGRARGTKVNVQWGRTQQSASELLGPSRHELSG